MKPGTKPKPTRLKVLSGNPGRRPLNENEPEPELANLPEPPEHFNGIALAEWARVTEQLMRTKALTKVDLAVLEAGVSAFARMRGAELALAKLGERGMVIQTSKGNWTNNPLIGVANKAASQMARIYAEFDMTPSSRIFTRRRS